MTPGYEGQTLVLALWRERLLDDEAPSDGQGAVSGVLPFRAISYDSGLNFVIVGETNYRLGTGDQTYTPIGNASGPDAGFGDEPLETLVPGLASSDAPGGCRLHLVQFVTQSLHEYRAGVQDAGGLIRKHYPHNTWIVECDDAALARIARLPYVRWTGPYHPHLRLMPEMRRTYFESGREPEWEGWAEQPFLCNIMVFEPSPERNQRLMDRIEALGGRIDAPELNGSLMVATLTVPSLLEVLRMDEVMYVDRWAPVSEDMDQARQVGGAATLALPSNGRYAGRGVRGEVVDSNFHPTHVDWSVGNQSLAYVHGNVPGTPAINHGTSTYGIVFGSGIGRAAAIGMLPEAGRTTELGPDTEGGGIFASFQRFNDYFPGRGEVSRFAHTGELVGYPPMTGAVNLHAVFQSNSWGTNHNVPPHTTTRYAYSTRTANMDDIIWRMDLVICQSMGNTGFRDGRTEAWAKNILSVGGVYHINDTVQTNDMYHSAYQSPRDPVNGLCPGTGYGDCNESMSSGCCTVASNGCNRSELPSEGPAPDGRNKPDLCHFFDRVMTTTYRGNIPGGDAQYTCDFGGTSAATPIVAGHFGVFFQMWRSGYFPGFGNPSATVFDARPHSTTARAMLINSAKQYPISQGGLARERQGWGLPDLLSNPCLYFIVDETTNLVSVGQVATYSVTSDGSVPLRVTLVYADPPGMPFADSLEEGFTNPNRVNDLDLIVRSPGGAVVYSGNHGLGSSIWSLPGIKPDPLNTVENVFIENPTAGTWTIEVKVQELNQDGDPETPSTIDIDFALVAHGVQSGSCAATAPTDWNHDDAISSADLVAYLTDFLHGVADFNFDGRTDSTDFFEFIQAFLR